MMSCDVDLIINIKRATPNIFEAHSFCSATPFYLPHQVSLLACSATGVSWSLYESASHSLYLNRWIDLFSLFSLAL